MTFLIVPNGLLTPSDWLVLSGSFLDAFFKFLVGNVVFFFNSKSLALLTNKLPPPPTNNPIPPPVKATVPVLTGSKVSLKANSFSTVWFARSIVPNPTPSIAAIELALFNNASF